MKRALLITIDTEGDRLWSRPTTVETRNAEYLPRFQSLCERYGFKPTYLTNYEMAQCPAFQEFAADVIRRSTGEVGMHLHAWNSPPLHELTGSDMHHQPFLVEYPYQAMEDKVRFMTDLLEERFGRKMVSHRAGRWVLNSDYVRLLCRLGYEVDCSVTPTVSWRRHKGSPAGSGGIDYTGFPDVAYFMDLDEPRNVGAGPLLQLPMTVGFRYPAPAFLRRSPIANLPALRSWLGSRDWFRPRNGNLPEMRRLLERARATGSPYIEFMLHSSEFMPGGSPTFPDAESVENLYALLEQIFESMSRDYSGYTLAEYHAGVQAGQFPALRLPQA